MVFTDPSLHPMTCAACATDMSIPYTNVDAVACRGGSDRIACHTDSGPRGASTTHGGLATTVA